MLKLVLIWVAFVPLMCSRRPPQTTAERKAPADSVVVAGASPDFETDILPILKAKCSPCHFTGGKMYDKLPFDKGQTIVEHQEGVLRRIKEGEGEKIRAFVQSQADL